MGQARTFLVHSDAARQAEQEAGDQLSQPPSLPRGDEAEHSHVRRAESGIEAKAAAGEAVGVGRVLLVDDHPELRRVWTRALRRVGHETEEATSAAEALEWLARERFDLVLSDVQMPDMSGLELLEKVRALDPDLSVVLLSGAPGAASVARARELGVSEYLTKPVDLVRLTATVGRGVAHTLTRRGDSKR